MNKTGLALSAEVLLSDVLSLLLAVEEFFGVLQQGHTVTFEELLIKHAEQFQLKNFLRKKISLKRLKDLIFPKG